MLLTFPSGWEHRRVQGFLGHQFCQDDKIKSFKHVSFGKSLFHIDHNWQYKKVYVTILPKNKYLLRGAEHKSSNNSLRNLKKGLITVLKKDQAQEALPKRDIYWIMMEMMRVW